MSVKTVVILGGGVGGLSTAKHLRRRLKDEHRIVVVDRVPTHFFAPSFVWFIAGQREESAISRSLPRLLGRGVEYLQGEVQQIEPQKGVVKTDGQEIPYDYLVVALGADLSMESVPGLSQEAYSFYDVESARRLREALRGFKGGSLAILIPSAPYKCPAAPYECAMLLDYQMRKRGLRSGVKLDIYTLEPQPLPVAGPAVGGFVKSMLEGREIGFHPGFKIKELTPGARRLSFENGQQASYDLLIAIPPHRCPGLVREAGLADQRGWVPVDKGTMKTPFNNVYAIGDVTVISLPSGMNLPKAGVFAHGEGKVVAQNIAADIQGVSGGTFGGAGS